MLNKFQGLTSPFYVKFEGELTFIIKLSAKLLGTNLKCDH